MGVSDIKYTQCIREGHSSLNIQFYWYYMKKLGQKRVKL